MDEQIKMSERGGSGNDTTRSGASKQTAELLGVFYFAFLSLLTVLQESR